MPKARRLSCVALVGLLTGLCPTSGGALEPQRAEQDGIGIEFSAAPLAGDSLVAGTDARFTIALHQGTDGPVLRGATIGGWLGARQAGAPSSADMPLCTAKAAAFSRGSPLAPPALDLNGYYLVTMNADSSLSIIDPLQGFGGSRLIAAPELKGPGADWVLTPDRQRLVVSEPSVDRVAIIDALSWSVLHEVELRKPARLILSPDGSQTWVAYRASATDSGVALLDLASGAVTSRLPTGEAPHDLAFADGGRLLLATNAGSGTVSVVDVTARRVVGTIPVAGQPSSIVYSPRAQLAYIADNVGAIVAIDPLATTVAASIDIGAGPAVVRVAPDDRFVLAAARDSGKLVVIDTASNAIVQRVEIGGEPDQIVFSDELAYVRRRRSNLLAALPLAQIGQVRQKLAPADVTAGQFALGAQGGDVLADGITRAPGHAAVVVANAADNTLYYYQEGMIAPQTSFDRVGVRPTAPLAADRSLREVAPGRFETIGRLPKAGIYDAVFYVDSPRLVQCFTVEVERRPNERAAPRVAFTELPQAARTGQSVRISFRLTDSESGAPIAGSGDVTLLTFRSPGNQQAQTLARATGDGLYTASFMPNRAGNYYVFVESRSLDLQPTTAGLLTVSAATAP
jgi:YVTN family beta-propeller protein